MPFLRHDNAGCQASTLAHCSTVHIHLGCFGYRGIPKVLYSIGFMFFAVPGSLEVLPWGCCQGQGAAALPLEVVDELLDLVGHGLCPGRLPHLQKGHQERLAVQARQGQPLVCLWRP